MIFSFLVCLIIVFEKYHRNNVRPQKRIFICFCQRLGNTTKVSSTKAAGSAKGSFPSGPPFLRGYISLWIPQWDRNWFLVCPFAPGDCQNHSSVQRLLKQLSVWAKPSKFSVYPRFWLGNLHYLISSFMILEKF